MTDCFFSSLFYYSFYGSIISNFSFFRSIIWKSSAPLNLAIYLIVFIAFYLSPKVLSQAGDSTRKKPPVQARMLSPNPTHTKMFTLLLMKAMKKVM